MATKASFGCPSVTDQESAIELDRYQYLILMGLCLVITLPLEFLFGARVWRRPRRLLPAVGITMLVFAVWDAIAVSRGHWTYNPRYVTSWELGNLPVEEMVFFFSIPICGLLTYEAVRRVLFEWPDIMATLRRLVRR